MRKEHWLWLLRILGIVIMLGAFPLIPKQYPWYYQVILFDIGLAAFLVTKWGNLKKELGITKQL